MICKSLWNAALSPSCQAAVLVSHISKLKALMGFRSSGEFFLFFIYFFGAARWGLIEWFRLRTFSLEQLDRYLKSPIRKIRRATEVEYRVSRRQLAARSGSCIRLSRGNVCVCVCVDHVWAKLGECG